MKYKDYYNKDCALLLADMFARVSTSFPSEAFIERVDAALEDKGLTQRLDAFADALEASLPASYEENLCLFESILGPGLEKPAGILSENWWLWPIGRYIERHGSEAFDQTMAFLPEMTKRFTAEFAVRPLLEKMPKRALPIVEAWSHEKNVHVRRLSSECLRIHLPWAKKLTVATRHFQQFKQILSGLRNAPERFVQKSVGNNINDLFKENAELAFQIIEEWQSRPPSKATLWIIRYGMRTEIKKVEET